MAPRTLVFLFVPSVASFPSYTPTPFGHVLSHCVHSVPNGAVSRELDDGSTEVLAPDGTIKLIPKCDTRGGVDPVLFRAQQPGAGRVKDLPPNYDGWLQYTALNTSRLGLKGGFDAFTNVMSVPDKPSRPAQILYFFPGLQDMDWIPKVDPEPTYSNFDIIQPVLQYEAGEWGGASWGLKSWYVTLNAGALQSEEIKVQEGDEIICNMTRTGPNSWIVKGSLKSDPSKITTQTAQNARLKVQPWAYNTLECYGCDGCDTYPKKPITFTENKLYQNGEALNVPGDVWALNPKPAKKMECGESTHVASNGDTTISFVQASIVV